jgi:hypothetical protein
LIPDKGIVLSVPASILAVGLGQSLAVKSAEHEGDLLSAFYDQVLDDCVELFQWR